MYCNISVVLLWLNLRSSLVLYRPSNLAAWPAWPSQTLTPLESVPLMSTWTDLPNEIGCRGDPKRTMLFDLVDQGLKAENLVLRHVTSRLTPDGAPFQNASKSALQEIIQLLRHTLCAQFHQILHVRCVSLFKPVHQTYGAILRYSTYIVFRDYICGMS